MPFINCSIKFKLFWPVSFYESVLDGRGSLVKTSDKKMWSHTLAFETFLIIELVRIAGGLIFSLAFEYIDSFFFRNLAALIYLYYQL